MSWTTIASKPPRGVRLPRQLSYLDFCSCKAAAVLVWLSCLPKIYRIGPERHQQLTRNSFFYASHLKKWLVKWSLSLWEKGAKQSARVHVLQNCSPGSSLYNFLRISSKKMTGEMYSPKKFTRKMCKTICTCLQNCSPGLSKDLQAFICLIRVFEIILPWYIVNHSKTCHTSNCCFGFPNSANGSCF